MPLAEFDANDWSDIMRWWSFVGAAQALPAIGKGIAIVRAKIRSGRRTVVLPLITLVYAGSALMGFLTFVLIAGSIIPFTSRISGFGLDHWIFESVMAVAWSLGAGGAWLAAVAFSRARKMRMLAAGCWFAAVCLVATATA